MREMNAALEAIYQAALDPGHWAVAMENVSILYEGRPALLQVNDTRTGELPLTASVGIDPAAWAKVSSDYSTLETNPTLPVAMTIPLNRAVDQAEAIGEDVFRKSALNSDVYRPQGQWPFLGTVSARSETIFAGITVKRSVNGRPPDRPQFQMAERLSAHVGRALALSGIFPNEGVPVGSFEAALHGVTGPVLILDASGKVGWRNGDAEALFARGHGLTCRANMLIADDPADQRLVSVALRAAARGKASTIVLARLTRQPLILNLQRLWRSQAMGRCNLMATIRVARRRARFDYEEAVAIYDLTAAEARVACEICATPGIEATARKLEISPNTVKSLLRRCFDKLGVRSQAELAMLFTTSLNYIGDWWA